MSAIVLCELDFPLSAIDSDESLHPILAKLSLERLEAGGIRKTKHRARCQVASAATMVSLSVYDCNFTNEGFR